MPEHAAPCSRLPDPRAPAVFDALLISPAVIDALLHRRYRRAAFDAVHSTRPIRRAVISPAVIDALLDHPPLSTRCIRRAVRSIRRYRRAVLDAVHSTRPIRRAVKYPPLSTRPFRRAVSSIRRDRRAVFDAVHSTRPIRRAVITRRYIDPPLSCVCTPAANPPRLLVTSR
jgi:hypothetical protein